ncbi:MAG: hypothetical protein WCR55_02835 [Lentisphaerota bacterium]
MSAFEKKNELKSPAASFDKTAWRWVPTLYFMEGMPGIMIMVVLAIMFKNFGIPNEKITLYTGSLVMPWVLKPIWAGFIDIIKSKRWWIYTMEICVAAGFVAIAISMKAENFFIITIAISWVVAFMASNHDIAADGFYLMELNPAQQSFFVGIQGAAYNVGKVFATGFIVIMTGVIFEYCGSYHTAWFFGMLLVAIAAGGIGIYHKFVLPKEQTRNEGKNFKGAMIEFWYVYLEFFKLERIWLAILFLFFYRAGESIINIVLPLFLLSPIAEGGLGLNNEFTGLSYGTLAPISIILGSMLGGYAIYRKGFKFWIWWMLLLENVPHLLYYVIAHFHIYNRIVIASFIFLEQLCFSFGLCAYSIFLFYMVRNSKFKTSHYAFFAGIMQLAVMIPVMLSGWLTKLFGYQDLFLFILVMIIPAGIIIFFVKDKIDCFGKRGSSSEVSVAAHK